MDGLALTSRQRRQLEQALAWCHDKRFYRRLLALRQIDQGYSISQAARSLGVSRQSIHHWLRTYREGGRFDRLADRSRSGRPSFWEP